MDKSEVIAGVAQDLYATEAAVDAALAQATALVQSLIDSRTAAGVSPVAFAQSQSKMIELVTALGVARDAAVAVHTEMGKDHRRMGWGVFAAGPLEKPGDWETRGQKVDLRVAS